MEPRLIALLPHVSVAMAQILKKLSTGDKDSKLLKEVVFYGQVENVQKLVFHKIPEEYL